MSRTSHAAMALTASLALIATACSQPANNASDGGADQGTTAPQDMTSQLPTDQGSTPQPDQGTTPTPDMPVTQPVDMGTDTPDTGSDECVDTALFNDNDGDGQGSGAAVSTECLKPGEQPSNPDLVTQGGDCNDNDPLQYEGSSGICGDRVDDDCDAMDEMCPATQPASTQTPNWDCSDDSPPDNVYAWARFDQGNSHVNPGCFVFFASGKDTFFVQRIGLDDAVTNCGRADGCVCTFEGGNGYDQRLYAFTRSDAADCPDIELGSNSANTVSNACRKYLYHMYSDDRGYSYAATGEEALKERLENFTSVEIACVKDTTFGGFPYQPLLNTDITLNDGFVMPR